MSAAESVSDAARDLLERTRRAQSLPAKVEDPAVLSRVAEIVADVERATK